MINGIPVALGASAFGTSLSQTDSFKILDKYDSLGGRIIDTANNYAFWHPNAKGGESESVIGNWHRQRDRSAYTIMTKIGSQPIAAEEDPSILEGLSPEAVYQAVDKSLARLKTDHIDILLAHHDDRNTPLLDAWGAFSKLVTKGKVRKVGVSNYSPRRLTELANIVHEHSLVPIDCVQLQYSIIDPVDEVDLGIYSRLNQEMKETLGLIAPNAVIFAYSPLLQGKVFSKAEEDRWPSEYDSIKNRKRVDVIRREAEELGVSPSAYVLKQIADQGIIPITATGKIDRLATNLQLLATKCT